MLIANHQRAYKNRAGRPSGLHKRLKKVLPISGTIKHTRKSRPAPLIRRQLVRETFNGSKECDNGKKALQAWVDYPHGARIRDQACLWQGGGRDRGISEQSYYRWREEYGGMPESQTKKLLLLLFLGRRSQLLSVNGIKTGGQLRNTLFRAHIRTNTLGDQLAGDRVAVFIPVA